MRAKRLEDYSERNQHLIVMARPDATLLAGYKQWQRLGRQVRKGEHGIVVGAPVTVKQDDGTSRMVNVRGARVFDVAQTDPIGSEAYAPVSDAGELEREVSVPVPNREGLRPAREECAEVIGAPFKREEEGGELEREPEPLAEIVTMVDPFGRRTTLGCLGCDHPGSFEHDARCEQGPAKCHVCGGPKHSEVPLRCRPQSERRLPEEDTPEGDAFEEEPDPVADTIAAKLAEIRGR